MRKILLTAIFTLLVVIAYCQQTETAAVKQTINTLFDAMRKGDTTLMRSVFSKGMVLQSISTNKVGRAVLSTDKADDFVKAIGTPHASIYNERISFADIKIDGDLANVWAPYKFYLGDKFSHCGVDVFQLMKTTEGWKIIYIVDTRRKDSCIE